jgi:hypothetical protein
VAEALVALDLLQAGEERLPESNFGNAAPHTPTTDVARLTAREAEVLRW